jgi:hypothetical protein
MFFVHIVELAKKEKRIKNKKMSSKVSSNYSPNEKETRFVFSSFFALLIV